MIARIKRMVRRSKGMEALQAVLLVGAGFLVVWGLMTLWDSNSSTVDENVKSIASGQNSGGKAAAGGKTGGGGGGKTK